MVSPNDPADLDGKKRSGPHDAASASLPPDPLSDDRPLSPSSSTPVHQGHGKTLLDLPHPKAEAIILAAVKMIDRDQRDVFIEDACRGDIGLKMEVKRVVQRYFAANGSFFSDPPAAEKLTLSPPEERVMSGWVGPYKLKIEIGEGGMGKVFVAEQSQPIQRRVALKMIKPGMDSAEVIGRFEAERQTLALMEHPYIASVLDAGVSENGTPYFVMEYVRGLPITEYCDLKKLPLRQRIELFIDVCQGIQHAHQKGIIHRDIKPSNVLVTSLDDHPVPKIIDFGIAKAIGEPVIGRSVHTRFRQVVGTPLYMSPEQAGLKDLDIDTRSDIYSLGILLFELLTGTPPVSKEVLLRHGEDELRRIVREEDSPLPSSRFESLSADEMTMIATNRGSNPQGLRSSLRGDLDAIVLKTLEKDRDLRYESASALAADLRRYLNHEPVLASPPSVLYRTQKFVRRRKGAILAVTAIALSLLVGTGVAVWQAVRANLNAVRMVAQEALTEEKARLAEEQRQRAEIAEFEHHKELDRSQELLYASSVRLASRHQQTGDSEQANRLLDNWIPEPGSTDRRGIEWHLLHNQLNNFGEELLQVGGDVSSIRMSRDNTYIVAATDGGLIWRYSLIEHRPLTCWETRLTDVRRMEFNPDGEFLAVISYEAEAVVIATATGEIVLRCPSPGMSTKNADVCFFKGQLLTTGNRGDISVWDLQSRTLVQTWSTSSKLVLDIESSPDQSLLAILSGYDGELEYRVNLMSEIGQEIQQRYLGLDFYPCSISLHPNNTLVAVGGILGELEVWDTRKPVRHRKWAFVEKLNELQFSADGQYLAMAERSGAIHVLEWRKATKPRLDENHRFHHNWAAHRRPARTVAFSADSRHVVTSGIDGRVVRWSRDKKTTSRIVVGQGNWELVSRPAPDVFATFYERTLRLNMLGGLQPITEITTPAEFSHINQVVGIPSQKQLAVSTHAKSILIGTIEPPFGFSPLPIDISKCLDPPNLKVLSDEVTLVCVGQIPELQVAAWDCRSRRVAFSYENPKVLPRQVIFCRHEDSAWVLTEGALLLIEIRTGNIKDQRPILGRDVKRIAISPSGKTMSVAFSDRRIELVDVLTNENQMTIFGHVGAVEKMAFSRDGKTLIALDAGGNLRFWNVSTGTELLSWKVAVKHFDLSDDDQMLSIHYEDVIDLYDLALRE